MKCPRRRLGHTSCWSLLSVFVVLAGLSGCTNRQPITRNSERTRKVQVKAVAVTQTEVERKTSQPASIHAYYRTEIKAKVAGFVNDLLVDIGDYVESGAELATLAIPELEKQGQVIEAKIRRFKAVEAQAVAGIELAEANLNSARAKLSEAESERAAVEASLAASDADFTRTEDLVQRGSIQARLLDESRLKRDSAMAQMQSTNSAIESAKADVVIAEAQLTSAKANRTAAQAETQIAESQLEELRVLIEYGILKAPFSGIITQRHLEPGDLVGGSGESGSRPLLVISHVEKLRVRIPVPENDALLVNEGDSVSLTFPSFGAESPIAAVVTRRSGSLDPSTRTMLVEAELENAEGKFIPGMFGQATIDLETKVAANMLPARAIRFAEDGRAYVYALGDDDKVSVVDIQTGLDEGSWIEVVAGLSPGRRVIDAHLKRFVDGQEVTVLENRL